MQLLDEGLVSLVGDSKVTSVLKKLAPKALVETCGMHDIGNLLKNALHKNLPYYDSRASAKYTVSLKLCHVTVSSNLRLKYSLVF